MAQTKTTMQSSTQTSAVTQAPYADAHPCMTKTQAFVEANRCLYCFDAPCTIACPTSIDVPSFINRISNGDNLGAASTILSSNVLGGMCARVCPTETLCEEACVRFADESGPVKIGQLQRYATDDYFSNTPKPLFQREKDKGKRVAVVGSGPASLSCAHRLAVLGYQVTLMEAKDKLGGLNEYGLAAYKTTHNFAQKEIDWLMSIGNIETQTNTRLGTNILLNELVESYDAVFLGMGLDDVNSMGIEEPAIPAVRSAVDFIADLRQANDPSKVAVGKKVVVIGGGMTAVDAAVQAKMLGAQESTIVYRRGVEGMSASKKEQEWAQINGVKIIHWASPKAILTEGSSLKSVSFANTHQPSNKLQETGETFTLEATMLLKAVGQKFVASPLEGVDIKMEGARIATNDERQTSHPKIWAGGDCRSRPRDLTVEAVEDGKQAAQSIDLHLSSR